MRWGPLALLFLPASTDTTPVPPTSDQLAVERLHAALRFERNDGQFDPQVSFVLRGARENVFLTNAGELHFGAMRATVKVLGAHSVAPVASGALSTKANYFLGNDRSRWRTNVPSFTHVTFPSIRDGIDLVYHCDGGRLEYDFVVRPKARFDDLAVAFSGVDPDQAQLAPRAFQGAMSVGARTKRSGDQVSFVVESYDDSRTLVIDPIIAYSLLMGGNDEDTGIAIAADAQGNAYVVGATLSTNFPTVAPTQATSGGYDDVFVAKLDPQGAVLYSTYIGGTGDDLGMGIAVDATGNAHVAGGTSSKDFPTMGALQGYGGIEDAFLLTLDTQGALLFSTYFGGSGGDTAEDVAIDGSGDVFITGVTGSTDLPTKNAFQPFIADDADAFVAAFLAGTNAMLYSTYLGGNAIDGQPFGSAIAVDAASHAYVTGYTRSTNFPTTTNAFQPTLPGSGAVFVTKLGPFGSLVYSTYLGGDGGAEPNDIAVDANGNAAVTGLAGSNFPTQNAIQSSGAAFVAVLNPQGSGLVFSTYLGVGGVFGSGVAFDGTGAVYVGGLASPGFPLLDTIPESDSGKGAFVAKLDPQMGKLIYSTFLGGSSSDLRALALDGQGNVHVTGSTDAPDFPASNPLDCANGIEAFVARIDAVGDGGVGPVDAAACPQPDAGYVGGEPVGDDAGSFHGDNEDIGSVTNGCSCSTTATSNGFAPWGALAALSVFVRRRSSRMLV